MRILHTSDWHLGRIFYGIHLTDDQAYVLDQLVKLVGEARPDVVVIAGDIYDRSVPPTEAVKLLDEVLSSIILVHKVPVIMIAGNHDSPERLGFGTRLLARQGLHLISQLTGDIKPIVIHDSHGPVYFWPLPYAEPAVVREKLAAPEATDHDRAMLCLLRRITGLTPRGTRTVALAHAFVAGGVESESERPLSVGGTGTVDAGYFQPFNYVALGHLHQPQRVGSEHIRYAGSLLKYSFSEAGHRKSVTLVEMDGSGKTTFEAVSLLPRRDVRCLEGFLHDILAGPHNGESRDDYLMVTLKDSGAIFDAVGKLREVYPNVLHIERSYLAEGELCGPGSNYRRLSEIDLFSSFYEQVTGDPLSDEQAGVFAAMVDELYRREREVRHETA